MPARLDRLRERALERAFRWFEEGGMQDMGVLHNRKHMKCAKICGDTSGNYHPHGEAVIYPTLVHMAEGWSMRERLVDGKGNFGSIEDDPPAAMRYTEARLSRIA